MKQTLKMSLVEKAETAIRLVEQDGASYTDALARCGILENFDSLPDTLIQLTSEIPHRQLSNTDGFAAPSVNLAYGRNTRMDLNIWFDQDTSIHSHAFNGAFGVVFGEASEEKGRMTEFTWHHGHDFLIGPILLKGAETRLHPGHIQMLTTDPLNFHRVGHLTIPTILCVIRQANTSAPGYEFFLPGLGLRSTLLAEFGLARAKLSLINASVRTEGREHHVSRAINDLPLRLLSEYALTPRRFGLADDTAFYSACLARLRDLSASDPVAEAVFSAQEAKWGGPSTWFRGMVDS